MRASTDPTHPGRSLTRTYRTNHWDRPLDVHARSLNQDYASGTVIAGISWKPEYSDLRISFQNLTGADYEKLDLSIIPNDANSEPLLIAGSGQTTNLPGVTTFNTLAGPDVISMSNTDPRTGKKKYVDQKDIQLFSGGIRVICDRLPRRASFEVSLAISKPVVFGVDGKPKINPGIRKRFATGRVLIQGTYQSLAGHPQTINTVYFPTQD